MSYQVFARKYRPPTFDEVVGQGAVVQTLTNAINQQRLHQAYLFCGARGVGKTSLARILAKSVNCEKGPTAKPCGVCETCKGIASGHCMDVLEIDGASNTSVDNVRELREQAKYVPAGARYKIYIIDEVHMLSTSAFNALLKILEEPPAHLIFVFATTEPHKIPITILSRCQRFDFRKLSSPELVSHLKTILGKENLKFSDESLVLLAKAAEGSVRDSLSLLDQVVVSCGSDASPDKVRELLGLSDRVLLFDFLEAILKSQMPVLLEKVNVLDESGFDFKIFSEGLLELVRHLLVIKEGGDRYADLSPGEREALSALASSVEISQIILLFQVLAKGVEDLSRSDFPRFVFEVTLAKMAHVRELTPLSRLIENLEKGGVSSVGALKSPPLPDVIPAQNPVVPKPAPQPSSSSPKNWLGFVREALSKKPQLGGILEQARMLQMNAEEIVLGFEAGSVYADMFKDRLELVTGLAKDFFGTAPRFKIQTLNGETVSSAHEVFEKERAEQSAQLKAQALENPIIKKAQAVLGARVMEVKELK